MLNNLCFFFLLLGQPSFPSMSRPIYLPISFYPLEDAAVHAGHKVLMEVDDNSAPIVGDPQGIFEQ